MLNRKNLIRTFIGFVVAAALVAPGAASAKTAPVVTVTPSITADEFGNCQIAVLATWNEASTQGPSVTVTLLESADGGPAMLAGFHSRIDDLGADTFLRRQPQAGVSYTYEVRITKGPKHMIAVGDSTDGTSCP